jgi:hypothetical protein
MRVVAFVIYIGISAFDLSCRTGASRVPLFLAVHVAGKIPKYRKSITPSIPGIAVEHGTGVSRKSPAIVTSLTLSPALALVLLAGMRVGTGAEVEEAKSNVCPSVPRRRFG